MTFGLFLGRKRALISLAWMALACTGCGRSPEAKSARYIDAGKALMQKGNPVRAILEFHNAVQAAPKNAEAYYQLGLAYLARQDYGNAVGGFRQAIKLNPKHTAAKLRLAELMASVTDPDVLKDAQQRLQDLIEGDPGNPDALHALALTELKLGDASDAMQHLELALADASTSQELAIAITLAQAKLQQKDAKGAEDVLKKACEKSSTPADAMVYLGQFYISQHRAAEAEQQFQRALSVDPRNGVALFNLAKLQYMTGRIPEAEQSFKRLSGLPGFKPVYAIFLFQTGRKDEAVREFERLAKADPEDRAARTRLVTVYWSLNRLPEAEEILNQALKKNAKDLDALLQRGEMYLSAGKYAQAETDLNQVGHLQPGAPEVHYILAKLHLARGAEPSYRQELTKALELNPYLLPVRLELARALLAAKNAQAALDVLNQASQSQKQSTPVLVQRNWVLWSLGDLADMRKGIDQGLTRERSEDLLIQDGLWKLRSGDPAAGRKAIEEALKIDPSDLRALQALTQTYVAQKNAPAALQKVKEYAASQPKSAVVQELLGELLANSGDLAGARAAFAAAKTDSPEHLQADLNLVRLDMEQGKWDDAQKRLEAAASAGPATTLPRLWLAVIEEVRGQKSKAVEDYRKVVDSDPNQAQALNNLAYLLADYSHNLDEALKYAQRAVELDPAKPVYAGTLGWILYQRGLYTSALPYLERASAAPYAESLASRSAVPKYHLAMAYAKLGDKQRSHATLEAALKLDPNLPEAKMARDVVGPSQ
jgi:tetratricopeptide (TPR) repeat protein